MPAVNPEILVWARETTGLTLRDAAAKVGIRDARGVAAVDRLAALERGDDEPTRPVLVRMAQHYRRPLLAFYLSAPPPRTDRGSERRPVPRTARAGRSVRAAPFACRRRRCVRPAQGDLGSHRTAIPVEAFRGFAVADDIAPFVVVNDNDSEPAWSFTLLHELVHLLLGQTGISGARPGTKVEEFCNNVAAEWMLPERTLDRIKIDLDRDVVERIGEFARPRNLSHTMVAYGLLRAGRIDQQTFDRLCSDFGKHWQQQRDRRRAQARKSVGGPDCCVVRRQRVGPALFGFARRMLESGALSTTKAARILDVKPAQVGRMLCPARARQRETAALNCTTGRRR